MSSNVYIARQHAHVFVVFVLVGVLFCVSPWFINDGSGILACVFLPLLGLLSIGIGLLGWKAGRVGIVADRNGIWCSGFSLSQKTLIPWDSILGIKKVTWTSPEGEHDGVLIGLTENMPHPGDSKYMGIVKSELERLIGVVDYSNPLMLAHDEWDWDIDEFVALVSKCIRDPQARKTFGKYKRSAAK